MDGFTVEEKRVGGLVHIDEGLNEGIHIIGGNTVLGHNLGSQGIVIDLGALGEDVGSGMADGRGAGRFGRQGSVPVARHSLPPIGCRPIWTPDKPQ